MRRMLINAAQRDEIRVAIINNGLLIDLDIEHPGQEQKKANIYKAVITSIEPSLDAVFVNYGAQRHGFLPLKEISKEYYVDQSPEQLEHPNIKKVLKEGQELVVQVDKEERGTKGAALTTYITLAGSYLVLMPNNPRAGGVSRRIDGGDREQMRETMAQLNVPEGMGLIVRTAGLGKSKDSLEWDLNVLLQYWEAIKQAAIAKPGPYLIHQESDVIIRTIRDYLRQDVEEIIIDEPEAFKRAKHYIQQTRPPLTDRIKLYQDPLPLFSRFQIEQQIENAYKREVELPSGGSIVIDHTEAMISIDINSARATTGSDIEETAYNTNLEAAEEIARQLRIRDIGGLIVIDYIDMSATRHQRDVENCLREALKIDRARTQVGRISRFGLLEMSRQRLRGSLSTSVQITCPRCAGRGLVRSVESLALSIIHVMQDYAAKSSNINLQVQVPVDVATFMLNEKRELLKNIEIYSQTAITIIPNPNFQSPDYHVKVVKTEHAKHILSYKLAKIPKFEEAKHEATKPILEPAISKYLATGVPSTPPSKKTPSGIFKRIWDLMFSPEEQQPPEKTRAKRPPQKYKGRTPRKPQSARTRKSTGRPRTQDTQGRRDSTQKRRQPRADYDRNPQARPEKRTQTQILPELPETGIPKDTVAKTIPKRPPAEQATQAPVQPLPPKTVTPTEIPSPTPEKPTRPKTTAAKTTAAKTTTPKTTAAKTTAPKTTTEKTQTPKKSDYKGLGQADVSEALVQVITKKKKKQTQNENQIEPTKQPSTSSEEKNNNTDEAQKE